MDPVGHPGAWALDLTQAPLRAPPPLCPPLVQHVEEPVAHDGVDLHIAAFCRAAAGLVFNECSGWDGGGGKGGTRSVGVRDLLALRLNDRKRANVRLFKRTKRSTAVGPWARPPVLSPALSTSKPQHFVILHSTDAVACTVKNNKTRSFSSVTVASIVEVTSERGKRERREEKRERERGEEGGRERGEKREREREREDKKREEETRRKRKRREKEMKEEMFFPKNV